MRGAYRVRLVVNLLNGSTAAGLMVAAAGRARLVRAGDGLVVALRYRLPVPPAPAFCLGNVIVTRLDADGAGRAGTLFRHEARHATQFACCGGVFMLPLYSAAAGLSWLLTGDFGARNIFERRAGLAEGGYAERPLRAAFARLPPGLGSGCGGRPGRRRCHHMSRTARYAAALSRPRRLSRRPRRRRPASS
jgi:hypothetical protein